MEIVQTANFDTSTLTYAMLTVDYIHEYSFHDVSGGGDQHVAELEAVRHYLTKQYFPQICKDAQNVISSVPVWKSGNSLPPYALTDVAFHVYSKVEITRHNWAHVTTDMDPIIVLFGVTGFHQLPASDHLDFYTRWIFQGNKSFSHGTIISISKRVFIQERLLSRLLHVNALTTLIPTPSDARGFGGTRLVTWAVHGQHKDELSQWEPQPFEGDGVLKYLWEHMESWSHNVSGNSNSMILEHAVSCVTRNYIEIPTTVKQEALRIKVSGSVELSLTTSETTKTMPTEQDRQKHTLTSSVSWSIHITVDTTGSGLKVNMPGSLDPVFTEPKFSGDNIMAKLQNPKDMLREAFPKKVDLGSLVQEINAFEGAWQYYYPLANAYSLANPVFNDDGDLLFKLRRYDITAPRASSSLSAGPRTPMNGSSGGALPSEPERSPLSPTTTSNQASKTATHASSGDGKTIGESDSLREPEDEN